MFDFPALDEAALEDLKEIGAARTVAQRKEAMEVFYTLSCDFRDAFSELEDRGARTALHELRIATHDRAL